MRANLLWSLAVILLGGFLLVIPFFGIDPCVARALYHWDASWASFANEWGYLPWRVLQVVALIIFFVGLFIKNRRLWNSGLFLTILGFLVPTLLVAVVLKPWVGRPRPNYTQQFGGTEIYREWTQPAPRPMSDEPHHSFPSGHAAVAAFMLTPFWVISQKRLRILILTFGLLWWVYISAGRLMLNVHFLSDTVASLWLTVFCGGVLAWWLKPLERSSARK